MSDSMAEVIFSIGHSTRPLAEFLLLLHGHGIKSLVDIRSIPRSRRNPQYDQVALQQAIEADGLVYTHVPALGGRRRAREGSTNTGWRNAAFQGYADYMQTEPFEQGVCELLALDRVVGPLAMMCSEAVPWRCHRSLVADALVALGTPVAHIVGPGRARAHRLNPMARITDGRLDYSAESSPRDHASPTK
jgi:uncharacterized protein (DUF488 family)